MYEKISENKENIKLAVQKTFTKIRNILNSREDTLLMEVDEKFNQLFFKEEFIKESDKFPNKIKKSLDKGKLIDNNWDDSKQLISLINDCITIENNIKDINILNDSIKKCNISNYIFVFLPNQDKEINDFLEVIKKFGKIIIEEEQGFNKSSIIKKQNEITKLKEWISYDKKIKEINLLYNSSEHGDSAKTFFEKCGNKGPTLSLSVLKLLVALKSIYLSSDYFLS